MVVPTDHVPEGQMSTYPILVNDYEHKHNRSTVMVLKDVITDKVLKLF